MNVCGNGRCSSRIDAIIVPYIIVGFGNLLRERYQGNECTPYVVMGAVLAGLILYNLT